MKKEEIERIARTQLNLISSYLLNDDYHPIGIIASVKIGRKYKLHIVYFEAAYDKTKNRVEKKYHDAIEFHAQQIIKYGFDYAKKNRKK